jgi:uncharacterized damage-inducible protein DinB
MTLEPEVWLRGPIQGFAPELMPVAHSLLQVREEVEAAVARLSFEELWTRPGGAAPVGFHVKHLAGSLDRLLTYARGERLTDAQFEALATEGGPSFPEEGAVALLRLMRDAIDRALSQVRTTRVDSLDEGRQVGRAGLPSTVRGLLFHAAEHTQRHAGQIVTTARIIRSMSG